MYNLQFEPGQYLLLSSLFYDIFLVDLKNVTELFGMGTCGSRIDVSSRYLVRGMRPPHEYNDVILYQFHDIGTYCRRTDKLDKT